MMDWLNAHLLTCPFKYLTGVDCPGCGFQRSVIALLKGNFAESFALYPAAVPILALGIFLITGPGLKLNQSSRLKSFAFIAVASIILISYSLKLIRIYA